MINGFMGGGEERVDERGAMPDELFDQILAGKSGRSKKAKTGRGTGTTRQNAGSLTGRGRGRGGGGRGRKGKVAEPLFYPGTPPSLQTTIDLDDIDVFYL